MEQAFLLHHAWIQHRVLTHEVLLEVLRDVCTAFGRPPIKEPLEISEFVTSLNKRVNKSNHALTFINHPITNEEFLVLAPTKRMPLSAFQECYRHVANSLVQLIGKQAGFAVEKAVACSAALAMLPHNLEQLEQWIKQGYFLEKDGMLYYGPRLLVEYEGVLKKLFSDTIKPCPLCEKIVLWDVACCECQRRIHVDCMRSYLVGSSNCPACLKPWNQSLNA